MRALGIRRGLHVSGGTLASLLACLVVAVGGLDGALFESSVLAITLMASVTVLVVGTTARRVGFHITVGDDREMFATPAAHPEAHEVCCGPFDELAGAIAPAAEGSSCKARPTPPLQPEAKGLQLS